MPAYRTARELLDISHQTQSRHYNVHCRSLEFNIGDLVWVTSLSGIAMGKWRGEHLISHKRLSPIHIERLTPYYSFTTINYLN
ncbi:unnamed protein product [Rotaria socialis]|uniref:Uncharacterized protein n=1 Tax=Rotaria socialis TaxID=392032 RepID=A0A821MMV2_9BILA|nr:unnamed protein product [Rotaria socialis]CAF4507361.1 unnamed protein product [Rotaria socialis]CAF4620619.1 unnamed protein product [Rotaria socialis]CAF4771022.1 unnamed protein product [Rotaria socialis]CAF4845133.1 unnamed protein product [Rotaria socialis]